MNTLKIALDIQHIAMSVPDHILAKIKPYLNDIEQQVLEGKKKSEEAAQKMCDRYCKYPNTWDEEKEECCLAESEVCKECPMSA